MSLYLPEQKLGSHSAEGSSSNKFMLKGRQTGSMHRGHSWVFRAESWDTMQAWVSDIQALTDKSPQERNAFVRQHARSISGTSQKASSISSDGLMDEEDEEPFSAANSFVAAQTPKQDVLPRRPQPGGRFPSDLKIDVDRSLQAPLSPSSGSSGFGDVRDRDVIAAPGTIPRSSNYGEDISPTHAAIVNQYAKEDGINPYTGEATAAEAVAGSVAGAAASEPIHKREGLSTDNEMSSSEQQRENLAALEPSTIVTPNSFEQQLALQAALEATAIAADDMPAPTPFPSDWGLKSSDHSTGGPSTTKNLGNDVRPEHATAGAGTQSRAVPLNAEFVALADSAAPPSNETGPSHGSAQSISLLHVPGEFPKGSSS
jgi:hypothetical protein